MLASGGPCHLPLGVPQKSPPSLVLRAAHCLSSAALVGPSWWVFGMDARVRVFCPLLHGARLVITSLGFCATLDLDPSRASASVNVFGFFFPVRTCKSCGPLDALSAGPLPEARCFSTSPFFF